MSLTNLHTAALVQAAGRKVIEDVRVLARDTGLLGLGDWSTPFPDALNDF